MKRFVQALGANPSVVLSAGSDKSSEASLANQQLSSQNHSLHDLLTLGFLLEERQEVLKIQWRFFTLAFYLRRKRFEGQQLQHSTLINNIIKSQSIALSLSDALKRIKQWIDAGAKYHTLVRQLGLGCLFLFPDEITRTT